MDLAIGPKESVAARPDAVTVESVSAELERILRSQTFSQTTRLSHFLNFIVTETLQGRGEDLKEYPIGLEVFQKPPSFDPRTDSIVRVEAARLRAKLKAYYDGEGRQDAVIICLPKRGYRPSWEMRPAAPAVSEVPAKARPSLLKIPLWYAIAAVLLAGVILAAFSVISRQTQHESKPGPPPVASAAVLRFSSNTSDPAIEYLGEGMTEEIISALSHPRRLRILATPSKISEPSALSDKLHVDTIITGSLRESKGRIRVTANVIQAATGEYLWSGTFERTKKEIFLLQDEVALAVRRFMIPNMEGQPLPSSRREHPEAYQEYLTGRHYLSQRSGQSLRRAIKHFQQAIALDPTYAMAYAGLASAHSVIGRVSEEAPNEYWEKTKWAATKALEHDENLAEAHTRLAGVLAFYEWNWKGAEPVFRRAIQLDEDNADAHHNYAHYLIACSRLDEALREMRRAQEIDPVTPIITAHVGLTYYMMRQYDRAIDEWRRAIELDPGFHRGHWEIARAYLQKAMPEQAIAELDKASSGFDSSAWLAACYARQGRVREVEAALGSQRLSAFDRVVIYAALRDREHTLLWLEKARDEHSVWLTDLNVDPMYDWLRQDPAFQTLVKSIHL